MTFFIHGKGHERGKPYATVEGKVKARTMLAALSKFMAERSLTRLEPWFVDQSGGGLKRPRMILFSNRKPVTRVSL